MNAITEKLHRKSLDTIKPFIENLARQGMGSRDIAAQVKKYIESKKRAFYLQEENESKRISNIMVGVLKSLKSGKDEDGPGDSKAEFIFCEVLRKNNIPFEFQYKIGAFRADFLIAGAIIFEGDGPQHKKQVGYDKKRDEYLERMGYLVVRVCWDLVAQTQDLLIEELKLLIKKMKL